MTKPFAEFGRTAVFEVFYLMNTYPVDTYPMD
jgi:hypothetical protein